MILDIIAGSVLLAFGIAAVYFTINGDLTDSKFLIILLLGFAAIIGGGWILITRITLAVILTKIAGVVLGAIGLFMVVDFPDITQYQREGFSITSILIGLVFLILGAYLLFFG